MLWRRYHHANIRLIVRGRPVRALRPLHPFTRHICVRSDVPPTHIIKHNQKWIKTNFGGGLCVRTKTLPISASSGVTFSPSTHPSTNSQHRFFLRYRNYNFIITYKLYTAIHRSCLFFLYNFHIFSLAEGKNIWSIFSLAAERPIIFEHVFHWLAANQWNSINFFIAPLWKNRDGWSFFYYYLEQGCVDRSVVCVMNQVRWGVGGWCWWIIIWLVRRCCDSFDVLKHPKKKLNPIFHVVFHKTFFNIFIYLSLVPLTPRPPATTTDPSARRENKTILYVLQTQNCLKMNSIKYFIWDQFALCLPSASARTNSHYHPSSPLPHPQSLYLLRVYCDLPFTGLRYYYCYYYFL